METLLSIILIIALLVVCWCVLKHKQNKNFQETMKPDDECFFTLEGGREHCHIRTICDDNEVIIEDMYGSFYRRSKQDLYL